MAPDGVGKGPNMKRVKGVLFLVRSWLVHSRVNQKSFTAEAQRTQSKTRQEKNLCEPLRSLRLCGEGFFSTEELSNYIFRAK